MALDIELRVASGGARGLTEMFRLLWDRFGRAERPITDADVRAAAAEIAGKPLTAFFEHYVRGTEDLQLTAWLERAGLDVDARPDWDESARPAADRDPVRARRARAWTGLVLNPDRTTVRNVVPGSPAWKAGLTFNDEIVAVGGARVTGATLAKRVADHAPGDRVPVAFFRRDELATVELVLAESQDRRFTVILDEDSGPRAKAIRAGWIGA